MAVSCHRGDCWINGDLFVSGVSFLVYNQKMLIIRHSAGCLFYCTFRGGGGFCLDNCGLIKSGQTHEGFVRCPDSHFILSIAPSTY